jgi:hypothetical protein
MPDEFELFSDVVELDLPGDASSGYVATDSTRGDEDFHSLVQRMIEDAIFYHDEHIDPFQVLATKYYNADEPAATEEGRSRVVATVVRDTVLAMMPSLLRIFFGPEEVVAFRPEGPEDVEYAKQATDTINELVKEKNPGFIEFYSAFKDALIRKLGVLTWWYDDPQSISGEEYTGLTEEDLVQLAADDQIEVDIVDSYPMGGVEGAPVLFDVETKRVGKKPQIRFAAVPPEELVWNPNARSMTDAAAVCWVRSVTASDLVAMGYDRELVNQAKSTTYGGDARARGYYDPEMPEARRIDRGAQSQQEDEQDDSTRPVLYCEAYIYADTDDDGISELRRVCTIGDDYKIVNGEYGELVDERPFALLCPDPEPHSFIGNSIADRVMDLQLIDSQVMRGMLDSLNWTLNPEREIVEGEVNMEDMMNTEIGKIMRVRRPGMIRDIYHDFVGREALSVLAYTQEQRENRTGQSKAAQGLDADALQSATKAAVAATMTGAQQHIELIARIFAETGIKDLFRGLLRLTKKHQNHEQVIRLRGQYVTVDPRSWNADMDVDIDVALGVGLAEEKIQVLAMIAEKQEAILAQGGPIVGWSEYRATLAKMVEVAGWKNSDEFYKPFGPEQEAMLQQQQQQAAAQQPDPMQMALQIEQGKLEVDKQKNERDANMKQQQILLEQDLKRDQLAIDTELRERELEMKYKREIEDAALDRDVELTRVALDADVKREAAARNAAQATPQGGT